MILPFIDVFRSSAIYHGSEYSVSSAEGPSPGRAGDTDG